MPTNKNEIKYARNATYGNVAYDLNRYGNTVRAPQPEYEYEPQVEREINMRPARATVTIEESHQGFSLFAVVGFAVLTALMVLVLMTYIQLTEVKTDTSSIRKQLTAAQTVEAQLAIKYENTFDLKSIEEYAVNELGMTKATEDQVVILENVKTDKAVVLDDSVIQNGNIFRTTLTAILEYFR